VRNIFQGIMYDAGYKNGKKEARQELKEQKKFYEELIKSIEYKNETVLMEKERANSILRAKINDAEVLRKSAEEKIMIVNRKERELEQTGNLLYDAVENWKVKMLGPARDILSIVGQIHHNARKDRKKISGG